MKALKDELARRKSIKKELSTHQLEEKVEKVSHHPSQTLDVAQETIDVIMEPLPEGENDAESPKEENMSRTKDDELRETIEAEGDTKENPLATISVKPSHVSRPKSKARSKSRSKRSRTTSKFDHFPTLL